MTVPTRRGRRVATPRGEDEAVYRELVATSGAAIVVSDRAHNILAANSAACALFDRDEADLRSHGLAPSIDDADVRWNDAMAALGACGRFAGELAFVRRGGERVEAEVVSNLYRDRAGRERAGWIVRDVTERNRREAQNAVERDRLHEPTERERAQKALRESELKLASIIDSAMDAVVTVDADERILVFNASAESMFRCAAEEAIGTSLGRFIPARAPDRHHDELERCRKSALAGRASGRFDALTGVRADGECFPLEASMSFVQVDDKPLYTVFLRDLTDGRRADDMRAQLEARLRDAQKMEAIGTLAGGIAHDFNNIVAAIVGNVELARHALYNGADAHESLDEIRSAGHRARDLVDQMLTFSQQRAPKRELIVMSDVVVEAAKLVRPLLPAHVDLVVDCHGAPPRIWADPTQLHRVLMNLATNAAHAMEGSKGTIRVQIAPAVPDDMPDASRSSLASGHYARLSVIDSGSGMDAQTRARMFEPFYTTKRVGAGTGLGLSVVHGIVTSHSGFIVADSAPGRGTRFDVYFPAVDPAGWQPANAGGGECAAHEARILYVDDDESLAFLASRLLRRDGFQVTTSARADDALGLVRADPRRFDLVVTDVNMPGLSGLEMARALRGVNPALPVVLTSGYVTEGLRADAAAIGIADIVYKQNTVEQLCAVVGGIARRRAAAAHANSTATA